MVRARKSGEPIADRHLGPPPGLVPGSPLTGVNATARAAYDRAVRAVVLDADGLPKLAELPEPTGPGALVRVRACGLCGSDVEKLGTRPPGPSSATRSPVSWPTARGSRSCIESRAAPVSAAVPVIRRRASSSRSLRIAPGRLRRAAARDALRHAAGLARRARRHLDRAARVRAARSRARAARASCSSSAAVRSACSGRRSCSDAGTRSSRPTYDRTG